MRIDATNLKSKGECLYETHDEFDLGDRHADEHGARGFRG